ncbi:MAG TPA: HAD family phosphatase [Bradyrhizobium sp.]|uniref:HAD family hydrolase n=1 Tax=Bradyrhizobium sp. TaxID=376 RepID=UPI002CE98F40|nr:HAD family phosphatase [Bradyrhizobium sp.]HTB00728.1 HAD family phosphatase [Bradyrhizobium sp.]
MSKAVRLPRNVRAVVFDMDGLLFDTEALYRDATMATAADGGHDISLPFYLTTIGTPLEATRMAFVARCGQGFDFDIFWTKVKERFDEMTRSQLRLKAGVVELLDFLDDAGLPRAIATSSRHEDAQHHLGFHKLTERFEEIVAHGDYSRGKPHPEPFLKAAERLGVEPELCVALEDSYHGVRAASGAGMMTIMVPDLFPATTEMEDLCVCIAKNLHEVRTLIRSQPIA